MALVNRSPDGEFGDVLIGLFGGTVQATLRSTFTLLRPSKAIRRPISGNDRLGWEAAVSCR